MRPSCVDGADPVTADALRASKRYMTVMARSAIGAALRLGVAGLAILVLLPAHALVRSGVAPRPVARAALRIGARLFGIRVERVGGPVAGPALIVANHVSWADILALAAAVPGSFVAKADVARWPLLGWLARRHGTVFVERGRRSTVAAQADALADRLRKGGSLILFPEGTSSDGRDVLPFKPALFAAAVQAGVPVQPVSLAWTHVGDRPVDDANRLEIAWIDDMTLGPHVWNVIRRGGATVRITCHAPLDPADFASRAELAAAARRAVLQAALRNRSE